MSKQTEAEAVEAQFEELAEQFGVQIEDLTLTIEDGLTTTSIAGADLIEYITEGDDEEQTPTESDDDEQSPTETEDTIEDGEVKCECGAVFDSKQSLYGHSSHCDEYESQSLTETEEEEDTTEGGENEITEGDEPEHPEDADNPTQENYVFHFGTCSEEGCSYGANGEEADYCASHQGSSSKSKTSKKSSSKKTKISDLTEGQKAMVQNLIEDEGKSLEEAVQMV